MKKAKTKGNEIESITLTFKDGEKQTSLVGQIKMVCLGKSVACMQCLEHLRMEEGWACLCVGGTKYRVKFPSIIDTLKKKPIYY